MRAQTAGNARAQHVAAGGDEARDAMDAAAARARLAQLLELRGDEGNDHEESVRVDDGADEDADGAWTIPISSGRVLVIRPPAVAPHAPPRARGDGAVQPSHARERVGDVPVCVPSALACGARAAREWSSPWAATRAGVARERACVEARFTAQGERTAGVLWDLALAAALEERWEDVHELCTHAQAREEGGGGGEAATLRRVLLGVSCVHTARWREAMRCLLTGVLQNGDHARKWRVHHEVGVALLAARHVDAACTYFENALTLLHSDEAAAVDGDVVRRAHDVRDALVGVACAELARRRPAAARVAAMQCATVERLLVASLSDDVVTLLVCSHVAAGHWWDALACVWHEQLWRRRACLQNRALWRVAARSAVQRAGVVGLLALVVLARHTLLSWVHRAWRALRGPPAAPRLVRAARRHEVLGNVRMPRRAAAPPAPSALTQQWDREAAREQHALDAKPVFVHATALPVPSTRGTRGTRGTSGPARGGDVTTLTLTDHSGQADALATQYHRFLWRRGLVPRRAAAPHAAQRARPVLQRGRVWRWLQRVRAAEDAAWEESGRTAPMPLGDAVRMFTAEAAE